MNQSRSQCELEILGTAKAKAGVMVDARRVRMTSDRGPSKCGTLAEPTVILVDQVQLCMLAICLAWNGENNGTSRAWKQ
jgi:hypothetical protein